MGELKNKFEELENRIQNLITSHQQLRTENDSLKGENERLEKLANAEKARLRRMEEGYHELKDAERTKNKTQIASLKGKVNEMISEIDRSVALIDMNHKQ
jgi:predicted  nucleic acid-binding Zn-ribbon protein